MGNLMELPKAVAIIGGGIIAVEYATVLAKLGVGVSLICQEKDFLPFLETELREALKRRMRRNHVLFVSEEVKAIEIDETGSSFIKVSLHPSTRLPARPLSRPPVERKLKVDLLLYSAGRDANSEKIGLENVNCNITRYGRIVIDKYQRTTATSEVFAVGDVIGPPGLASAAQQQARALTERLFANTADPTDMNDDDNDIESDDFFMNPSESSILTTETSLFGEHSGGVPLTLWTIPEVASVGFSKSQIATRAPPEDCVEGYAYFKDMARGRLSGDLDGFLKVVTRRVRGVTRPPTSHRILGVFIFGEGANELIQLGSVLVNSEATVEQVSRTPFAAVTLCGLFQMACDDAIQKLRASYMQ
jgi:NAD(P) transhydrogenase